MEYEEPESSHAPHQASSMNKKFPILSLISVGLRVVGSILFIFGGFQFLFLIIALSNGSGNIGSFVGLPFVGGMAVTGLAMIYSGELVRVFFTIEGNTRRSAEALEGILDSARRVDEAARNENA
jgi:hypothetical protein